MPFSLLRLVPCDLRNPCIALRFRIDETGKGGAILGHGLCALVGNAGADVQVAGEGLNCGVEAVGLRIRQAIGAPRRRTRG